MIGSPRLICISEYDEKHAGLKQNKETLDNHFRSLKKGMNKSRDQDREKLTKAGFQIETLFLLATTGVISNDFKNIQS